MPELPEVETDNCRAHRATQSATGRLEKSQKPQARERQARAKAIREGHPGTGMFPDTMMTDRELADIDLAARIADRICLVKNGSVFAEGVPEEIFYDLDLIGEAGLKVPQIVSTYLEYCARQEIESVKRPVRWKELIQIIGKH
jgi:hypothetical protein